MSTKREAGQEFVTLGRLGMPHGVKGWLKLHSFTDPPDNILGYGRFQIMEGGQLRELEIDESRPQGKSFIAHVKGCDDRELARQYTGRELLLAKAELPTLETGDYYWYQLQGLRVLNLRGELLGVVSHLIETGANDVLVLRRPSPAGDADAGEIGAGQAKVERAKAGSPLEEILVPYVPGAVVRRVDLAAGLMEVDWEAEY